MSVVAFTIAYGKKSVASARLLRATFKAVHPGVPFFVVDEALWPFFARQATASHGGEIISLRTLAGHFLALHFDRVVYFDADVLLLSPVPRLLERRAGDPAVLLTRDPLGYDYALPDHPFINAGVVAASGPDFWLTWAMTIYSNATRLIGNFFDQYALRLLAQQRAFDYRLLPEGGDGNPGPEASGEKEYYNISYRDIPGEWWNEGTSLFKGDGEGTDQSRILLWHWAGFAEKPSPSHLPPPIRALVQDRLTQASAMGLPSYEEENGALHALIAGHGASFLADMERRFAALPPLRCCDEFDFHGAGTPPEGLFSCDAPAGWEEFRAVPPGLHRRRLTRTPRYLYAHSEARLREADVEDYDRPFQSSP